MGDGKNTVKGKGLRVNVDKTKGMQLLFGKKSIILKVDPCVICRKLVVTQCTKWQRWIHRRCFDVSR